MKTIRTTIALLAAALATLTACGSDQSAEEDDLATAQSSSGPTASASASATPVPTAASPTYTAAESDLLNNSSVDWTGDPANLFAVADTVCAAFEKGKQIGDAANSISEQTTLEKPKVAENFAVDIVSKYCPSWAVSASGEGAYWTGLDQYIGYVATRGYGDYVDASDVIPDSTLLFCAAGQRGGAYNDIAGRIRSDYFSREEQVRDYIGHGFEFVCPTVTVPYAPPPPLPAATDFYGGSYRVGMIGKNFVQSGTYAANTDGDGCYWERNDASGNIIDNNISNGLRVQVTIYPSDYSFNSNNCGHWRKVD